MICWILYQKAYNLRWVKKVKFMTIAFVLKKIVSMFLMPLSFGFILLLISLFFLYKGKIKKAKIFLLITILWLFPFSYTPFVNMILVKLEYKHKYLQTSPKDIKYIYLLGSGHHTDKSQPITSQLSSTAVVRFGEAFRLYKQHRVKLILSGYSGLHDKSSHASMQKKLALSFGVDKEDIILVASAKDTKEEAKKAKEIIKNSPFILVTSASHMYRAVMLFRQVGLNPLPAPTNYLSTKNVNYLGVFSSTAIYKAKILFHEILGILW
jgi:uncharacterized SAM-binding protein YcdF (DUF218 family)